MHMVDLMSSIICEGDTVSQELLDTVLVNLVPAHKVQEYSDISVHVERRSCSLMVRRGRQFRTHTLQFTETPAGQIGYSTVLQ